MQRTGASAGGRQRDQVPPVVESADPVRRVHDLAWASVADVAGSGVADHRGPSCRPCVTRARPSSVTATAGNAGSRPLQRDQVDAPRRRVLQRVERHRVVEPELAAPGPPQRLEARAGARRARRAVGERPHVEAGRAGQRRRSRARRRTPISSARVTRTGTGVSTTAWSCRASSIRAPARRPSSPRRPAAPAGTRRAALRARVEHRVARRHAAASGSFPSPVMSYESVVRPKRIVAS